MIISTKGRYALRVMVYLAKHPTQNYVPLQEITDQLQISKEYLNSILKILVQNEQLASLRGKGGGYKLCLPPEEYKVGTILRLVEGDLAPVSCVQGVRPCPSASHCGTHILWKDLDQVIQGFLDGIHLSDFLEGGRYYTEC